MPALNFQKRFADKVASGRKRQSIRKGSRFRVGDRVYMYTGQRTRACRKLGESVCTRADSIQIERGFQVSPGGLVLVNGRSLDLAEVAELSRADGFEGVREFWDFFCPWYEETFAGQLIEWAVCAGQN